MFKQIKVSENPLEDFFEETEPEHFECKGCGYRSPFPVQMIDYELKYNELKKMMVAVTDKTKQIFSEIEIENDEFADLVHHYRTRWVLLVKEINDMTN